MVELSRAMVESCGVSGVYNDVSYSLMVSDVSRGCLMVSYGV